MLILVQYVSNMSSRRHHSLALHIWQTDIQQPHEERLEKNVVVYLIPLRNVAFLHMEINYSL